MDFHVMKDMICYIFAIETILLKLGIAIGQQKEWTPCIP